MKKILFAFLLSLLLANPAFATLAIDGTPVTATGPIANAITATLTTPSTNDIIVVWVKNNSSATVTGISDTAGLTWNNRTTQTWPSSSGHSELWWALAPTALTSDAIVVQFSGSPTNGRVTTFGVNGANTTTPFDTDASLPGKTSGTSSPASVTISTTNANTMLITEFAVASTVTITRPSGFTQAVATGTLADVAYKIVSSAQSSLAVAYTWTGSSGNEALIVDAIQASGGSPPPSNMLLDSAF